MDLQIYQVVPMPAASAAWLRRILDPVVEAMKFAGSPTAIEFRPTGRWSGYSPYRDVAPDGRVAISNLVLFRSRTSLVDVYAHEVAHSILHAVEGAQARHDCPFFALSLALRIRVDKACAVLGPVSLVSLVSLYDLAEVDLPIELEQDRDAGLGRCITWSMCAAQELAESDLSAEAVAAEIVRRYQGWIAELRDRPRLDRIEKRKAMGKAADFDRLQDRLFFFKLVSTISITMLVLIAIASMKVLR